jgi:hypothetical protein
MTSLTAKPLIAVCFATVQRERHTTSNFPEKNEGLYFFSFFWVRLNAQMQCAAYVLVEVMENPSGGVSRHTGSAPQLQCCGCCSPMNHQDLGKAGLAAPRWLCWLVALGARPPEVAGGANTRTGGARVPAQAVRGLGAGCLQKKLQDLIKKTAAFSLLSPPAALLSSPLPRRGGADS